jgi:catechol 2,3-dioxygenase-like lactoylglutathione lyase family enzyme
MTRTNTSPLRITDVRTVGVPVTDQDAAIGFYVDTLGFEKRLDGAFGEGFRWVEVAPASATTSIALVQSGPDAPAGIDTQIRLRSRDVQGDHASLLERGVDIDPDVVPYPVPMFVFRDPDGNRLIVVEDGEG